MFIHTHIFDQILLTDAHFFLQILKHLSNLGSASWLIHRLLLLTDEEFDLGAACRGSGPEEFIAYLIVSDPIDDILVVAPAGLAVFHGAAITGVFSILFHLVLLLGLEYRFYICSRTNIQIVKILDGDNESAVYFNALMEF